MIVWIFVALFAAAVNYVCTAVNFSFARMRKKYIEDNDELDAEIGTEFVGYDHLTFDSKVSALTTEDEIVDSLMEGQKGTIFVEKTPFYATMGGQVGDTGVGEARKPQNCFLKKKN